MAGQKYEYKQVKIADLLLRFFRAKMQLGFTGRIRFVAVPRIPLTVSISHALSA